VINGEIQKPDCHDQKQRLRRALRTTPVCFCYDAVLFVTAE
jgi:hypothetical protein